MLNVYMYNYYNCYKLAEEIITYTKTLLVPFTAEIPCVAVNLCPGELILDTSNPDLSVATSSVKPRKGTNVENILEMFSCNRRQQVDSCTR